jgi:hypothetical protein
MSVDDFLRYHYGEGTSLVGTRMEPEDVAAYAEYIQRKKQEAEALGIKG